MKYFWLYTLFFFILPSCVNKKIEYKKIEHITVLSLTSKSITLSAEAIFKNPNILGGTVYPENIKVFLNDEEISLVESKRFKVPAVKEFSLPLKVTIPFDKLKQNENESVLGSILSSLTKTHKISFKGILNYKVAGIKSSYVVNHTEELKLKL